MTIVTQGELKIYFNYDPETGVFTRRMHLGNNAPKGEEAGSLRNGYWVIGVDGKYHPRGRLAWLYVHGELPDEIDHINHDKTDDRISNLRSVTGAENKRNRPLQANSSTQVTGVGRLCPRRGQHEAYIYYNGKRHQKRFKSFDDAVAWRKNKEHEFGFHKNHGANPADKTESA